MLPLSHLLTFAALAAVVIAIPGPSVLFTIGRDLSAGRREALLTVAGNAAGEELQVIAVAIGLGAVIQASAVLFTLVKVAGGLYLVFLGVQAIRHRRSLSEALAARVTPSRVTRALRQVAIVGVTNPKTIVFLAAVVPQFAVPSVGSVQLQLFELGTIFPLIALILDTCWALSASTARAWFARSPRRLELVGGTGGLAMIGVGVGLVATGRKD